MKMKLKSYGIVLLTVQLATAIELNVSSIDSIKSASSTAAYGLVKWYTGNITNTPSTVGVLPGPYYWWEGGALWGALIDYWRLTNDSTYNKITTQALLSQVGPLYDYMVPAHVKDEGNDDQAFWGFATMAAAEYGYPSPPSPIPSWLQLTINLWNTQVVRWDTTSCGGGLKWQIFTFNNGYDYKNSVSNGAFFMLSARLARYTGNSTYVDWAIKSYDWSVAIGLISPSYAVYDGTDDKLNCSEINRIQFSYNQGLWMYGAAMMYNYTNGSSIWEERTKGFLDATAMFFSPFSNSTDIMFEQACEGIGTCNYDQFSFKAYLSRYMWASTVIAPFTQYAVTKLLTTSAKAAAVACSGGADNKQCGAKWYIGGWDGTLGVGQQMAAMETFQGLLSNYSRPPGTSDQVHLSGGTTSTVVHTTIPSATVSIKSKPTFVGDAVRGRAMATGAVGAAILAFGAMI